MSNASQSPKMGLQISASSFFFLLLAVALAPPAKPDASLIQKACRTTKYYDLCLSSLESDPSSSRADPKGLASIALAVALANATSTSSFLSSLVVGSGGAAGDPALSRLLRDCADKYGLAGDALQASARDLAAEAYDYAYMHAMAAEDYPSACRNAFRRSPGTAYPPELARREDGLRRICDVVMGIIDFLGW